MGKRYIEHSDMCGCERCAVEWERENPSRVWDEISDPDYFDCGCAKWRGCDCAAYDYADDYEDA